MVQLDGPQLLGVIEQALAPVHEHVDPLHAGGVPLEPQAAVESATIRANRIRIPAS